MKNAIFTKKALSLLLVMSMLLTFVGCSKGGETPTTASTEPSSGVETEPSGVTDQADVFVKPENYATVIMVTINPQFRLYLDADGIVLAVEAVNKDAVEIKESISFENDSYETVVEKIVTKSEEKGYIKSDAVISVEITEAKDPAVNTVDILDKITITVNQTASNLELTVEIKTEDNTTVEKQPDVDLTEPTEDPTTAPTTSSTVTTPTTSTQCSHTYKDATCTAPKTCSKCGKTSGSATGHSYKNATCTAPKTCTKCGATTGNAAGHSYKDATCTAPKTCTKCGATTGNAAGHSYKNATCTAPKTCTKCGATTGNAAGHSYKNATCTAPKTCNKCGVTEGTPTQHKYDKGSCSICGQEDIVNPKEHFKKENYIGIEKEGEQLRVLELEWTGEVYYYFEALFIKTTDGDPDRFIDYEGERYYFCGGGGPPIGINLTDTYVEFLDPANNSCAKYMLQHDGSLRLSSSTNSLYFPQLLTIGSTDLF